MNPRSLKLNNEDLAQENDNNTISAKDVIIWWAN
jgi:hypothetical protein